MPRRNKLKLSRLSREARQYSADFTDGSSQDEVFRPEVNTNNNAKGDGKPQDVNPVNKPERDDDERQESAKPDPSPKNVAAGGQTSPTKPVTRSSARKAASDQASADKEAGLTLSEQVRRRTDCVQLDQAFEELGTRNPVPSPDLISMQDKSSFDD